MSENTKGVLDPQWEDELRAGSEADGGQGSVEAELAVVHLFRHAAGPETLEPEALEAVWSDVSAGLEAESGFTPWWRRILDWRVGVGVAVAAAAAAVLVLSAGPPRDVVATPDPLAQAADAGMSMTLEAQFEMLAPTARAQIGTEVDRGRGAVRDQLIASLRPGPDGTIGGAP